MAPKENRVRADAAGGDAVLAIIDPEGNETRIAFTKGAPAMVVGRAAECDVVLVDRFVSRRHLRIDVVGESRNRLHIARFSEASPVRQNGVEIDEATLAVGDEVVVGRCTLVFTTAGTPSRAPSARPEHIPTARLFAGEAHEVRGFLALIALADALRDAADEADALARLCVWARAYVDASDVVAVREGEGGAEVQPGVVERRRGDHVAVTVPSRGAGIAGLTFELGSTRDANAGSPYKHRLLFVAGALSAAAFARIESERAARQDSEYLRIAAVGSARAFLGTSAAAVRVARLVPRLAASDATVLLAGESGTGKSFVARLLHESGIRAREPLRIVNCGAIPDGLLESELFGHERGAFTGAVAARVGAFEAAGRGTLFLDEIAELPLAGQVKLLRALEERTFERVGSNRALSLDARVVVATNRDLPARVAAGTFRQDLFYRISVVTMEIPPLRDRGDDLVLLAQQLLGDLAARAGRLRFGFAPDALTALQRYQWPGNVRELRNVLEAAIVLGDGGDVLLSDLPPALQTLARGETPRAPAPQQDDAFVDVVTLPLDLASLEVRAIESALRATGGNRTRAAALLGVSRVTLHNKLGPRRG